MSGTIEWTPRALAALKDSCNHAVSEGKTSFNFGDHPLVTEYAKYLIEHLENKPGGK